MNATEISRSRYHAGQVMPRRPHEDVRVRARLSPVLNSVVALRFEYGAQKGGARRKQTASGERTVPRRTSEGPLARFIEARDRLK